MKIISFIKKQAVIKQILQHLGLCVARRQVTGFLVTGSRLWLLGRITPLNTGLVTQ